MTNDKLPFLDMKMSWSPEGDLQLGVFRTNGQQLKYVGKEGTHTPGTLCAFPSGLLSRLAKLISRKTSIHSEEVYKIYPDHTNTLRKAGLAPPNFPTMGDLWSKQDEKVDIEKITRRQKKIKTEMSTFVLPTHVIFLRLSTG